MYVEVMNGVGEALLGCLLVFQMTSQTPTFDGVELHHITGAQWHPEVILAVQNVKVFDRKFLNLQSRLVLKMHLLENWKLITELVVNDDDRCSRFTAHV